MLAEVTTASTGFFSFLGENLNQIIANTGFANITVGHLVMILVGLAFLYLAISRNSCRSDSVFWSVTFRLLPVWKSVFMKTDPY